MFHCDLWQAFLTTTTVMAGKGYSYRRNFHLKTNLSNNSLEYFSQRRIHVSHTPPDVLRRARLVIERLEGGVPYWRLRGKRLRRDRDLISIPIGRKWQILAVDSGERVIPCRVLSHARYNDL